jgi:hypothetical protein
VAIVVDLDPLGNLTLCAAGAKGAFYVGGFEGESVLWHQHLGAMDKSSRHLARWTDPNTLHDEV